MTLSQLPLVISFSVSYLQDWGLLPIIHHTAVPYSPSNLLVQARVVLGPRKLKPQLVGSFDSEAMECPG